MRIGLLVGLLAVALAVPVASAVVTGATLAPDGDGAIAMQAGTTSEGANVYLTADGTQLRSPGQLVGTITTDTETDPTAVSNNTVLNDTGFAWNQYTINVYMKKSFNFVGTPTGPANWTAATAAPTYGTFTDLDGTVWTNSYMGSVIYTSSAPIYDIAVGSAGAFDLSFSWIGSTVYQLELVPTPEPVSLALLALGGLFLRRRNC
jgi:hypothetical protein